MNFAKNKLSFTRMWAEDRSINILSSNLYLKLHRGLWDKVIDTSYFKKQIEEELENG